MNVPEHFIRTKADKLAVEQGCYWDQEQANRVIEFAETYFLPQFVGGKFRLLDWQRDWLSQLYGWRLPDGRRRWRKALLTVAKKNGKSLLCSIVALYESLAAGVQNPLCVSCSTTRQNATQIFDEIKNSVRGIEAKKGRKVGKIVASQKSIRWTRGGEFRSISNDSGNAEGLNLSCAILDEVHAWQASRGEQLYRTLEFSTISRDSGVLILISTAGHDQSHFFYDLVTKARNVLKGDDLDTSFFATVFEADTDDDIDDPKTWAKANPSLGTSFTAEDFRRDLQTAKAEGTASLLSFRRYRLNSWVQADDAYIDPNKWDRCFAPATEAELVGRPLYVGVDLSQTTDTCAVSCVWALPDRKFFVRNHSWVCEEGARRRDQSNLPRYSQYQQAGYLTITKGTCNDYRQIHAYLLKLRETYNLKTIVFDQANAIEMTAELMAGGITCERQPQNHRFYSGPMKEFEVAVNEQRVRHDGNTLMKWTLQNTRVDTNAFGDVKPSREKSSDKIDCAVALLMGFGRAVTENVHLEQVDSIYNSRRVLFV